jgi:hypothetical protein
MLTWVPNCRKLIALNAPKQTVKRNSILLGYLKSTWRGKRHGGRCGIDKIEQCLELHGMIIFQQRRFQRPKDR